MLPLFIHIIIIINVLYILFYFIIIIITIIVTLDLLLSLNWPKKSCGRAPETPFFFKSRIRP